MIEATATVLRVEHGRAWVKVSDRQEGCGRCDEPGGCRSVKIAYALRPPVDTFSVPDSLGVAVGDELNLRIEDGAALRGALASYGLAVVLLLAGAAAGHTLAGPGQNDLFALVGGAGGIALAFVANRVLQKSRRWRGGLRIELAPKRSHCSVASL